MSPIRFRSIRLSARPWFGRIDILVNNAGFSVRGAMEEVDEAKARAVFDVNVWGMLRVTRAVLPPMRAQQNGRIIHVGSIVGKFSWPLNGAYAASKHALEAMTDAMRLELRPFGIQVVLIEPGAIDNGFLRTSESLSAATFAREESPYARLYAALARASTTFPWSDLTRTYVVAMRFNSMSNWLPRDEAIGLRREFAAEMDRLYEAADEMRPEVPGTNL